jgi:ketosteroid isomerase-like protein
MPIEERTLLALDSLFPEGDWVEMLEDPEIVRSRLDLLRGIAAEDLEVSMIGPGGFAGTFTGIDGFESAWRDWLAPFATYRIEREEDYLLEEDVAVFFARQFGTPKGSSAPMENDGASVFFFRDGKVIRIEFHLERASALRSAGLD